VVPLDVRQRPQSIQLQLEQKIGVVEGRGEAQEGHRVEGHVSSFAQTQIQHSADVLLAPVFSVSSKLST
jgi:hypothetical protein